MLNWSLYALIYLRLLYPTTPPLLRSPFSNSRAILLYFRWQRISVYMLCAIHNTQVLFSYIPMHRREKGQHGEKLSRNFKVLSLCEEVSTGRQEQLLVVTVARLNGVYSVKWYLTVEVILTAGANSFSRHQQHFCRHPRKYYSRASMMKWK